MSSRFYFLVASCLIVSLSGCSQISGVLGGKPSAIPLQPLKEIKSSLKTNTVWQVNTGNAMGENKIHPYIDSNTIYIAGGTSASALQKSTGKQKWKVEIGESITAGVSGTLLANPQNRTQVKTVASQVFIGTSNGNAIALDAKTGKIQWIERLSSEILSISPSDDGRVAFRTVDGKLHGLESQNGELIWQRSQKTPALTLLGASAPIIVSNIVISGFDNGKVAAYDLKTGKPVWEIALALPSGNSDLEQMVDIDGRMKALGNALFVTSINGSTVGINMESGKRVWAKSFSSSTGVDVNAKGLFSSDDKGNIWAVNPNTGSPIWNSNILTKRLPSLPMIINQSTLVVTDAQGEIHFLNADSGKFVARQSGDPTGYSVEPSISGRSVYLMGKSGLLTKISL